MWIWIIVGLVAIYAVFRIIRARTAAPGLDPAQLQEMMERQNARLIDVRTAAEYRSGHIPGATNISHDTIGQNPPSADRDSPIVLYCRSGHRSQTAEGTLRRLGYTNVTNFGSISRWHGERIKGDSPR